MPTQQEVKSFVKMSVDSSTKSSIESVVIVDDHNFVIGVVPREKMRKEALCHRATYVFVFNREGKLYVQKRTLTKDIYPGYFNPATGGVVTEGESYDQAAYRELTEELGIEGVQINPHFHFFFHNEDCQVWGRVYTCYYDGPLVLQEEEVTNVVMEAPEEILSNRHHRNYTPDSLAALDRLVHCLQSM
ncbi:MAG: NUDIX hydrolase YfcD [Endozoicomonas sp.]